MDRAREVFRDRAEAGRRLAPLLEHLRDQDVLVLALPRGGVAVGREVATHLGAPLDVIVARKLGAPGRPELGIGAIAPGGVRVVDERALLYLGIPESAVERLVERETVEMERRAALYRGGRPDPQVRGRCVVLVDDGLATGVTARAAALSVRARQPARLVLAAPVCAADTADSMRQVVDELVCLLCPDDLWAVGMWYEDFRQLTDDQVMRLLEPGPEQAGRGEAAGGAA